MNIEEVVLSEPRVEGEPEQSHLTPEIDLGGDVEEWRGRERAVGYDADGSGLLHDEHAAGAVVWKLEVDRIGQTADDRRENERRNRSTGDRGRTRFASAGNEKAGQQDCRRETWTCAHEADCIPEEGGANHSAGHYRRPCPSRL